MMDPGIVSVSAKGKEELFLRQKQMLDLFLEKKAITRQQYEKSLHDLAEKMGYSIETEPVKAGRGE